MFSSYHPAAPLLALLCVALFALSPGLACCERAAPQVVTVGLCFAGGAKTVTIDLGADQDDAKPSSGHRRHGHGLLSSRHRPAAASARIAASTPPAAPLPLREAASKPVSRLAMPPRGPRSRLF